MHGLLGVTTVENERNVALRRCKIGMVRSKWPKWVLEDIYAKPWRPKRDTFFIDTMPWVSHPIIGRYA